MATTSKGDLSSAENRLVEKGAKAGAAPASSISAEDVPEMALLRGQLHEMRQSIELTKSEIAAVRRPGIDDDRLTSAAMELDAIVEATEEATHEILNATEEIEEAVRKLRDRITDAAALEIVETINGLSIKILEACNFQDISGQRTGKVVKTIHFLEERIGTMIDIWGAEEFADVVVEDEEKDEDAKLLEGPQLKDQGVNQADIDAMFD